MPEEILKDVEAPHSSNVFSTEELDSLSDVIVGNQVEIRPSDVIRSWEIHMKGV